MIVILLGCPGSGKGTQSKILAEKYGFEHLATGDIFRSEMTQKTTVGGKAAEYVKSGRLVPDELVTEMVAGRLDAEGGRKYLLDGFPRTVEQARGLTEILAPQNSAVDAVVFMNLPRAEALKRLTSRRTCEKCGEVYNMLTRPAPNGACVKCGGKVLQREDDSEATAAKRLMVFEDLTNPLVAYYRAEQVLHEIDAARAPEQVTADISAIIDRAAAVR